MSGLQSEKRVLADSEYDKKHPSQEDIAGSDVELDGIHDGLEFPTDEERATLRRVPDKFPWNAYCELRSSDFSLHFFLTS